jgi:hypothetical protein
LTLLKTLFDASYLRREMMLTGLDILLARMKTNPEEFLTSIVSLPHEGELFGGRWADLLDYGWRVADDEERKALQDAKIEFYRDDFNERVMKRLAGEETPQEQLSPYIVKQNTAQAMKNPIQNAAAAQQQMLQNSVLQGGQYDPNIHGYLTTTGGNFQAAELKQEGMPISNGGTGFTGFLGLGKLFWGKK